MKQKESVSNIVLLSKKSTNATLNVIRKQVDTAVSKKNYEWKVARIDEKGNIEFE